MPYRVDSEAGLMLLKMRYGHEQNGPDSLGVDNDGHGSLGQDTSGAGGPVSYLYKGRARMFHAYLRTINQIVAAESGQTVLQAN